MLRFIPICWALLLIALTPGCGGDDKHAVTPIDVELAEEETDNVTMFSAESAVGGLNYEKVDETFASALEDLQSCLNRGSRRVEFLGGAASFLIKINEEGRLSHAHLEESSLGDRVTERCMLDALKSRRWPKPVGGKTGLARKSFEFDPPNDVRPPTDWDEEPIQEELHQLSGSLSECGSSSSYVVTMYVQTDGSVLAAGISSRDESVEDAADCIVDALLAGTFPSPGSWPAKVSFRL